MALGWDFLSRRSHAVDEEVASASEEYRDPFKHLAEMNEPSEEKPTESASSSFSPGNSMPEALLPPPGRTTAIPSEPAAGNEIPNPGAMSPNSPVEIEDPWKSLMKASTPSPKRGREISLDLGGNEEKG